MNKIKIITLKLKTAGLLAGLLFLGLQAVQAQTPNTTYPKDYFGSPLNIPLTATSSFAEIRPSHWHSGLDFSVQRTEGLPVKAVADGYVSRLKVQAGGFGNAVYINHPNGYTSVYAHLQKYNQAIASYVNKQQYAQESFEVDLFPSASVLPVKKGDIIGYSGNTGNSFGAHLHFEIRNTATEKIINPLLFGYNPNDKYPPAIDLVKVYNYASAANNDLANSKIYTQVASSSTLYKLKGVDTLKTWGRTAFGVQASDVMYATGDKNGWYSVRLYIDDKLYCEQVLETFAFAETRYMNACIDYKDYYNSGRKILRFQQLPGNKMSNFKTLIGDGTFDFSDEKFHTVRMEVADVSGNTTQCIIPVLSQKSKEFPEKQTPGIDAHLFAWNKENTFKTDNLQLSIPVGCLYDNIDFEYLEIPKTKEVYSVYCKLHDPTVPLHQKMTVSIKPEGLPEKLYSKALLVRIDRDGKRSAAGGSYKNGWVTAETNLFDTYAVAIDTIKPKITFVEQTANAIRFTISDNLSGIATYRGTIDDKWVLMEYDAKNRALVYRFDNRLKTGKNAFKLVVTDAKGNQTVYTKEIVKK